MHAKPLKYWPPCAATIGGSGQDFQGLAVATGDRERKCLHLLRNSDMILFVAT